MAVAIEFGSQGQAATGGGPTATITGLDFNAEASDRLIAACIALEDASENTIASVTIGGETATQRIATPNTTRIAEIWVAAVPTGTSGDVVVTLGTDRAETISVATHSITGADATPTDTDSNGVGGNDISITALTIPTDGAGLCTWCCGSSIEATWTGASETHDTATGASYQHSSAIVTTAGTNTITADGPFTTAQALVGVAWGPASGGGVDEDLEGTAINGAATVAGALTRSRNLAGSTTCTATVTGDLAVEYALSGSITGSATVSGDLEGGGGEPEAPLILGGWSWPVEHAHRRKKHREPFDGLRDDIEAIYRRVTGQEIETAPTELAEAARDVAAIVEPYVSDNRIDWKAALRAKQFEYELAIAAAAYEAALRQAIEDEDWLLLAA